MTQTTKLVNELTLVESLIKMRQQHKHCTTDDDRKDLLQREIDLTKLLDPVTLSKALVQALRADCKPKRKRGKLKLI